MGDPASDGQQATPLLGLKFKIDPALAPLLAQPLPPGGFNRYRLFDNKLTLDPGLMADFSVTLARLKAQMAMDAFMRPNWQLFAPDLMSFLKLPPPNLLTLPPPPPSLPSYKPGDGPDAARAADVSDLLDAVSKTSPYQNLSKLAQGEGLRQLSVFEREWKKSDTYSKIVMVSMSGIVAAGIIGPILYAKPTRTLALGALNGRDIPVPGLDGFKLRLLVPDDKTGKGWGGGATVPLPLGGSVSGSGQTGAGQFDLKIMVTWDLMKVLPKLF